MTMKTVLGHVHKSIGQMSAVELIEQLDRQYPERCITPDETIEHARFYAGKRDLVVTLLAHLKRED